MDMLSKFRQWCVTNQKLAIVIFAAVISSIFFLGMSIRTFTHWLLIVIAGSDVIMLILLFFYHKHPWIKTQTERFNWDVGRLWAATTFGISLTMLIHLILLFWRDLSLEGFLTLTITPFVWGMYLTLTSENDNITKTIDGVKWLVFWLFMFRMIVP